MNPSPKNSSLHKPVLLQTALNYLGVQPGKLYIDATLGDGGHTAAILIQGGRVLGLDQDPQALDACRQQEALKPALASGSLILVRTNFTHLIEVAKEHSRLGASGILFDLGVSSRQLDAGQRGFSFQIPGPLDMRLDQSLPHTAATLVNTLPAGGLAEVFARFGQIPVAASLAAKVAAARPLTMTTKLAAVTGKWSRQAFQALRIAVNDELGALETALPQALDVLAAAGRLVVISFHSLEDRLVKRQFATWSAQGLGQVLTPRPDTPSAGEISANPRASSAKLRAFQKN